MLLPLRLLSSITSHSSSLAASLPLPSATRRLMATRDQSIGKFLIRPAGHPKSPPRDQSIRSLFRKQQRSAQSSAAQHPSSSPTVKLESDADEQLKPESPQMSSIKATGSKAADARRKRRVVDSDEENDDAASDASETAPPPQKKASTTETKSTASTSQSKPKDAMAAMMGKAKAQAGKGKQKDVKPVVDEEEEIVEAEADEEEREEKEEGKARQKLASIFEKPSKDSGADDVGGVSWAKGQPVPYAALSATFVEIEATTKRLVILELLTKFLLNVVERSPDNLLQTVYLCINRICPDYEGLELGIGESILLKAIAQSTGRDMKVIKKDLEAKGDLGLVAIGSRQKQPTMFKAAALTVPVVFKTLKEIAAMSGQKSQDRKIGAIKKLLAASVGDEPKFLMRSLEGKLRIGLAEKTVVVALAQSVVLAKVKEAGKKLSADALQEELTKGVALVKAVFSELPSYDLVVPALLSGGTEHCRAVCKLTPGIPLKPMLAKPTKAIGEVLDRFEGKAFTCEYKYDGERAQVHYFVKEGAGGDSAKATLAVFSRNSEDMSLKYPDLVEQVPRCINQGVTSFVLDCEAAAWKKEEVDVKTGEVREARLLPFQELSRRKRKDVKAEDIVVNVKLFAFDLLYLNGEPLINMDLSQRRKLLRDSFVPVPDEFDFGTAQDCHTVDEIQSFLDESVKSGCEGLMVKMLEGSDATYEPSRRSMNWLKLKKDYLAGTGDSLDLVVIGGYHGKGKRTNVYGAFLLACYDSDSETYQAICKIGTGFSEADLELHHKTLQPLELATKKGYYDVGGAAPDVYFEPKVLWEVLAADLSLSPIYTAAKGLVDSSRGISLRFPRYLRKRDDKDVEDSTGPEQVAEMYRKQAVVNSSKGGGAGGDDDFW